MIPDQGGRTLGDMASDTPREPTTTAPERQERVHSTAIPPKKKAKENSAPSSLLLPLTADVDPRHTDLPVLACCFISGLCDSVTVNASNVFVSMQTGNTVFLALGTAGLPATEPTLWLRSLVSIASFALGCFSFATALRRLRPTRKATLAFSFSIQALAIFLSAILAQTGIVPDFAQSSVPGSSGNSGPVEDELYASARASTSDQIVLLPVALIAWQFGGQIVASRVLGFNEVPTCVLTSVYCDLVSDPGILAPLTKNPKRNRRFLAVVLLLVGGICGGWLQRSAAGMTAVLWIAGSIKLVIAVLWAFWRGKKAAEPSKEV